MGYSVYCITCRHLVSNGIHGSPVANAFRICSPFIEIIYDVLEFR